jgi:hypothetical protein
MLVPLWLLITLGVIFLLLCAGFIYAAHLTYKHAQYSKKLFVRTLELIDQRDKLAQLLAKTRQHKAPK